DPQSFNRYSYTQNDPVNFVDPTGLLPNIFCDVTGNGETGTLTYCVVNGWDRWGGYNPPDRPHGDGTEAPQNTAQQNDPCDNIVKRLAKVLRLAAKRARELQQDFLDLVP